MSESVSGVDAILDRLRHKSWWIAVPETRVVEWADAEAAVHATVREIETWLRERGNCEKPHEWIDAADEVARRFGGTA